MSSDSGAVEMNSAAPLDLSVVTGLRDGRSVVRILTRARDFCLLQKVQLASNSMGARSFSRGQSGRDVKLSIPLHLEPRLRKSGVIPLLSLYAFMEGIGKTIVF
jgi:hypothetical protein